VLEIGPHASSQPNCKPRRLGGRSFLARTFGEDIQCTCDAKNSRDCSLTLIDDSLHEVGSVCQFDGRARRNAHQTSATLKDGGNPRDQQNRMTRKAVNIIRHSRERGVIEDLTFA